MDLVFVSSSDGDGGIQVLGGRSGKGNRRSPGGGRFIFAIKDVTLGCADDVLGPSQQDLRGRGLNGRAKLNGVFPGHLYAPNRSGDGSQADHERARGNPG
jgi:hypothetical protein